jgi:hypothetical protein
MYRDLRISGSVELPAEARDTSCSGKMLRLLDMQRHDLIRHACTWKNSVAGHYSGNTKRQGDCMSASLKKTGKSTIGRHPERGSYDRAAAHAILDEALVAHVGFDTDDGVVVVP